MCVSDVVICYSLKLSFFFFFQAEDGIRDLVRSRGLGDVYKRQEYDLRRRLHPGAGRRFAPRDRPVGDRPPDPQRTSVSYTHLTLPTSDLV